MAKAWVCMAINGYTWQYTAIHSNVWQYMAIQGYTWLYMAIHGYLWQYIGIHGYTWQYKVINGYTWQYMGIYGSFPITMEEFKGKTKMKCLGDLEALKSFAFDSLKSVIYLNLTDIFNLSISSGVFPDDWKVAKVCPLFKSDERNHANNFRPILVLPNIAHVFERLLYGQIYNHFSDSKLLHFYLSELSSFHSTISALFDMTNDWCFNIDRGLIMVFYFLTSCKKAFDTVDLNILIQKLQGPLLFLIYVNDMSNCLDSGLARLFADETNLTFTSRYLPVLQCDAPYRGHLTKFCTNYPPIRV